MSGQSVLAGLGRVGLLAAVLLTPVVAQRAGRPPAPAKPAATQPAATQPAATQPAALTSAAVPLSTAVQDESCWLRDVSAPTATNIYTLCQQGTVWATADGGATWAKRQTGAKGRLRAIAFMDAKRGITIGDDGAMFATEDAAKTWKPVDSGTKDHLLDLSFVGELGWAAGFEGVILHSTDGGRTWAKQKADTGQAIESIFFLDANQGWAAGWAGTILRTTDGGKTWQAVKIAQSSWSLTCVYFRDAKEGWISGFAGQVLHSKDGGLTWETQKSPVQSWLTSIGQDPSGRLWMTYDDGLVTSDDGGANWKLVDVGGHFFLGKLFTVDKTMWVLGQSALLRQSGNGWRRVESLIPDSTAQLLRASGTDTAAPAKP
jgi:photosystem II stability/assembly factor-like uncharacterized protein